MTADPIRWVIVVAAILCILGLVIWARGATHHRGEDVGAFAATYAAAQSLTS